MPSWQPTLTDVQHASPGRVFTPADPAVAAWISEAVREVVGEVGHFDADRVINPEAQVGDRVTFGDLARDVAALRAAYLAERRAPEQSTYAGDRAGGAAGEMYARYRDALDRLRTRVGGNSRAFSVSLVPPDWDPGWAPPCD